MENQTPNTPTLEQMISNAEENIKLKTKLLELQKLNTEIAQLKMEEVKAWAIMAQLQAPAPTMEHTVTEEDLENNPELKEEGIQVGEKILVPQTEPTTVNVTKRNLKKD